MALGPLRGKEGSPLGILSASVSSNSVKTRVGSGDSGQKGREPGGSLGLGSKQRAKGGRLVKI